VSAAPNPLPIYLEIGAKRSFAGALAWPGWCRLGRDPDLALAALLAAGPRYAQVLLAAQIPFSPPATTADFAIVEQLVGNSTTDFGAPDLVPAADREPVDDAELLRFEQLLRAFWQAFDAAVEAAEGKQLQRGPRGGGRDREGIVAHVIGADCAYLASLPWSLKLTATTPLQQQLVETRQAMVEALGAAVRGELPAQRPRGGTIWPPRYFVRRVAWHVLDHTWELEDRRR
jgi:hypothetical protein